MITLIQVPRYIALLKKYSSKPTLTKWLKNDGDLVEEGQPLAVVETSKAALEIDAKATGLLFILRNEREKVKIGDTLGIIADSKVELHEFLTLMREYPVN